ncbi:MAG: diacylglycerol kinase family lipid kinase [Erysipelotrichaceae bacterium]|nr:diacylglycerol kinase family lipid kinase [Erysipelotrichaceae bacterium]
MKKALVLLNPSAGNNYGRRNAYKILEKLAVEGYEITVYPILPSKKLGAEDLITKKTERYDLIACCGGDGTLHHVINALVKNDVHKPILYYPAGTTNDFAKTLNIPNEADKVSSLLTEGDLFRFDLGQFNEDYFDYIAAFGAFTDVAYSTDQNVKNLLGYSAYLLQTLGTAGDALSSKIRMSVKSKEYSGKGEYLYGSVSNSYSLAGIKTPLLSTVNLTDGVFEVALVKAPNNIADLLSIIHSISTGELDDEHIKIFRTKEVSFSFEEEIPWTLDGEFGGAFKEVDIKVLPKAVRIYAGKKQDSDPK